MDGWKSQNGKHFYAIGAAFIDSVGSVTTVLLDIVHVDRLNAGYLKTETLRVLELYSIHISSITMLVADGASVMKTLATLLEIPYLRCVAHVVNSALKRAIARPHPNSAEGKSWKSKELDTKVCWLSTFRRAYDLILLWKNTHAIASRYRGSSLKQFVSTRFFTWIISIRSIVRNEAPLSELFSMCEDETMECHGTQPNGREPKRIPLGQGKRKSYGPKLLISDQDLHFSADDWVVMHHFVAAFEHIETFTQSCQGSTYVTAGEFFRRLAELRNTLDSEKVFQRKLSDGSIVYHNVDDTGRTLHQTVRNMLQNFWTYFNDHVPIQELRLCSLLNPRTKGDSIHESLSAKVVDWDVVYQMRVAPQMRRVVEEKQLRFLCTSNADGFTHWLQKHYAELDQDDNPQPPQKRQRIQWPQYTEQDVENAMFRE